MKGRAVLGTVVIGPHGVLTTWVFDVVRRLCAHDPARTVRLIDRGDSIEGLAVPKPIYLTHYPSPSLLAAIESGDANVLCVLDDPVDVAAYLQSALGLPLLEAVRAQTATAVANLIISRADDVLLLNRATEQTVRSVVTRIASHLSLFHGREDSMDVIEPVCDGHGAAFGLEGVLAASDDHYVPPLRLTAGAAPDDLMTIATSVLDPLVAMARGDTLRPVAWPTPVFKFGDRPDDAPPRVAEVSGPARVLYYGPYFYLPPARYRVEAILAFSDEIQDVPFVLEVHGATWMAKARIERRKPGGYRGYFILDHQDPMATIEIRLRNETDVPQGRLALIELLFFVLKDGGAG